ncbi:disulfide bond formation protein B [Niveispirillum sp. KHB5.9]|uniref:disulfide bond formation protein B n=1 Tax=Niveispirillum sp. KHB5.9 TaxID=3400269 RepID=UPI003A8A1FF4
MMSKTTTLFAAPRLPSLLLILAALTALGTAFASQYWGGLNPCDMCWWQRYAYMTVILPLLPSALLRLTAAQRRVSLILGGLVFLVGAGISLFHAGVEQKWWEGFTACTAPISSGGLDDLRAAILAAPVVRCDEIPWSLFGISIAGFSAIASLILALFAFKAAFSTEQAG